MTVSSDIERLSYSTPLMRQICDHAAAVVYVKDSHGRYRFVNRRFLKLFGGAEADYLGRSDAEIFPAATAAVLAANDRTVLESGKAAQFEEVVPLAEGPRTYVSVKFPLYGEDGRLDAIGGISTDISRRKRTEDLLRRAALEVSASTGKGVFDTIVRSVADTLGATFVFLTRLVAGPPQKLDSLAVCIAGKPATNLSYELAGTPCEQVIAGQFHHIPDDLARSYPRDGMISQLGLVSYAGYPLHDSRGHAIGNIAIAHTAPLMDRDFIELVLRIFSVRAAAELERLQAEEQRQASESSYRAIFEASEDAILVLDIETGAIVDANPKACDSYGYSYEELLATHPEQFNAGEPLYTNARARQLIRVARDGTPQRFEWRHRAKDGSLHWDEVVLKQAQIAGVARILAIVRDISARKAQELALRRRENELSATVNTALDCIIATDAEGLITEFNPAAERCFGYQRAEVLGEPMAELIIPDRYRAAHEDGMRRYRRGVTGGMIGRRAELSARRADGSEFPVELTVSVAEGPEGTRFIGYLRDITDRKKAEDDRARLEDQLRQAQKMEAIGHLAGGIAHDFNNILTSAMGYLVMAAERAAGHNDNTLETYLARAQRSGERARDLIQQMLTFSRGQRGEPRPLEVDLLIREVITLLRSTLPSSLRITVDAASDLPVMLLDPIHVEQIVMNLLINARDAVRGNGHVNVELQRAHVEDAICMSCRRDVSGGFVEITVGDDGPGIPPEIRDRIFEPFFSTKEAEKGSGMGLATVHGIVHEYGGHILVESPQDSGTCFRILLPEARAADAGGQDESSPGDSHRDNAIRFAGQVLLVDDEPSVAEFMHDRLASWGLDVVSHGDPETALAAFDEDPHGYDLAILDYTMYQLNGLELARRLLSRDVDLPVIIYTGYAETLSEAEASEAGVCALLRKPVDVEELKSLLERLLPERP